MKKNKKVLIETKNNSIDKPKQGKRNRAAGARFELKVRNDLESNGWIVDKWTNNVEWSEKNINLPPEERTGKLVKAKPKFVFNPQLKRRIPMGISTGFPDFIGFRPSGKKHTVIGIEVKRKGLLDKSEKEKCTWYLKNKIFTKILIAKSVREGRRIKVQYIDFKKKYG